MQKYLAILYFIFLPATLFAQEENHFLMLKNNEVNVRYGPSFDYPIKYIYKRTGLPLMVIDKKENFRRIIDHKKKWWLDTYISIEKIYIIYNNRN